MQNYYNYYQDVQYQSYLYNLDNQFINYHNVPYNANYDFIPYSPNDRFHLQRRRTYTIVEFNGPPEYKYERCDEMKKVGPIKTKVPYSCHYVRQSRRRIAVTVIARMPGYFPDRIISSCIERAKVVVNRYLQNLNIDGAVAAAQQEFQRCLGAQSRLLSISVFNEKIDPGQWKLKAKHLL